MEILKCFLRNFGVREEIRIEIVDFQYILKMKILFR